MSEPAAPPRRPPEENRRRWLWIGVGVAVFLAIALVPSELHRLPGYGSRPARAAAVAALMAVLWFTEALPIGVTAILPIVLYPVLGVFGRGFLGDSARAVSPFLDAYIFLFMGGMTIGAAMEQWNLHRRLALHVMRAIGTDPRRLLLGMLVATAFVSLWISNTATAVTMVPIGIALVAQLETQAKRKLPNLGCALLMGIAYAANLGGIGTKIGTATNSIFCGFVADKLHRDLGFVEFLAIGLPFVVLFLPLTWLVLWSVARHDDLAGAQGAEVIEHELAKLGPPSRGEQKVALVFGAAALAWILGDQLRPLVAPHVPTFWEGYRFQGKHYEALVGVTAALLLIGSRTLSFRQLRNVPWDTLLLLGGSFAMAAGIEESGLSSWLATRLAIVKDMPVVAQLAVATTATIALTAVASNTATVNVLLNVLPPSLPLLAACALGASCDFALPAGTPPNAIVFSSGYVRLRTMMRTGAILDLAAAATITVYGLVWLVPRLS